MTESVWPAACIQESFVKATPVAGLIGTPVVVPENGPGPIELM